MFLLSKCCLLLLSLHQILPISPDSGVQLHCPYPQFDLNKLKNFFYAMSFIKAANLDLAPSLHTTILYYLTSFKILKADRREIIMIEVLSSLAYNPGSNPG